MERLRKKVAVITGASTGIGHGIALAFAHEGADIIVNYKESKVKADKLVAEIKSLGRRAIAIQADMSNEDAINALIRKTWDKFGCIDIWVNNAGANILTGTGAIANLHVKLAHLIEVDLKGTINACWMITPIMQKQGHGVVINMGWDLSTHGFEGKNPQIFAATKAGILGFTRSYAKSVAPTIRVNMVSPGWIATTFARECMKDEYYQARIREIPLARFGTPADVAAAVVFLASDDSSYITGEVIKINGGLV